MAQYLTKADYEEMGGADMSASEYGRHEFRARKAVDIHTFGRVQADDPQREAVKRLMYDLITLYASNEALRQQEVSGGISSWSNDGVSGGIKQAASASTADVDAQVNDLVWDYLSCEADSSGTPLLYRGVGPVCP